MARRERDYAAEYAARVERAEALGYSRSFARGHPRADEISASQLRQIRSAHQVAITTIPSEKTPNVVGFRDPKTGKIKVILLTDQQFDKLIKNKILDTLDVEVEGTPT